MKPTAPLRERLGVFATTIAVAYLGLIRRTRRARAQRRFRGGVDSCCPDWHLRLHYLVVRSFASPITAHAVSGCELVDGSVVVITPMNGSAVKIAELIDDHAVIRERAIGRALERMNYGLGPLTAANRA